MPAFDRYGDDDVTNDEAVRFEGTVLRDEPADKAVLFKRPGEPAEWLPRSQVVKIEHDSILLTPWIVEQKGWDDGDEGGMSSLDDKLPF